HNSLSFPGGLSEATATFLLFAPGSPFPSHSAWLAWIFCALCWLPTATRICSGFQTLKRVMTTA
ncbi:CDP-alcohol phosphatidyltransferase family protein, partial [Klebsiella pneumoniae]|nr:CDP-alcohol phosphatidyltransferase family protein [Klebsiella pneumoniae]